MQLLLTTNYHAWAVQLAMAELTRRIEAKADLMRYLRAGVPVQDATVLNRFGHAITALTGNPNVLLLNNEIRILNGSSKINWIGWQPAFYKFTLSFVSACGRFSIPVAKLIQWCRTASAAVEQILPPPLTNIVLAFAVPKADGVSHD